MDKAITDFYRLTKFRFDDGKKGMPQSEWPWIWKKVFYKSYARFPAVDLPRAKVDTLLKRKLISRRTTREFSGKPLELNQVSNMLQLGLGISDVPNDEVDLAKRTYPSAGARYPIESYVIANAVSGLSQGLYHFNVKNRTLETMMLGDLHKEGERIVNGDLGRAPMLLILTGVIGRSEVKYGVNAYRFALIESGHIGQNISLLCEDQNLGSCAIGGFDNDRLSTLLDLTDEEIPLYMISVGAKNEED